MTKKLFLENSYIREFKGKIEEGFFLKDKYAVVLNKTYFYPEAGGQPSDLGTINGINVMDVYYYEDKIIHLLEKKVTNEEVNCVINWNRRYSFMQQHTGQHILSRVLENIFDVDTVGFHIGKDYVTIDTNKVLSKENLLIVEKEVNKLIYRNLEINYLYPSKKELDKLSLRNPPSVNENIRIVKIGDFDVNPCGGTHVKYTGEVGILKIRKYTKNKDGLRINFVCGNWALKDYQNKNDLINQLIESLGVPINEIFERINTISDEMIEYKKHNENLEKEILSYKIDALIKNAKNLEEYKLITKDFPNLDIKELRYIVQNIVNDNKYLVCLTSCNEKKSTIVIGKNREIKISLEDMFKRMLNKVDGKGGGSPFLKQGSGKSGILPKEIFDEIS